MVNRPRSTKTPPLSRTTAMAISFGAGVLVPAAIAGLALVVATLGTQVLFQTGLFVALVR
jgi:hypothetical protein